MPTGNASMHHEAGLGRNNGFFNDHGSFITFKEKAVTSTLGPKEIQFSKMNIYIRFSENTMVFKFLFRINP